MAKLQWQRIFGNAYYDPVEAKMSQAFCEQGKYMVDYGLEFRTYFDNGGCVDVEFLGPSLTRIAAELKAEVHRSGGQIP